MSQCLAGTALPASFTQVCFMKFIRLSNVSDFILKPTVCIHIHIRHVKSSLAVVVFFIVKSENKRSICSE